MLNRDDIGALAPGMNRPGHRRLRHSRAWATRAPGMIPVAALVFLLHASGNVATSIINGRVVVRDGELLTADLPVVLGDHRRLARTLFERAAGAS